MDRPYTAKEIARIAAGAVTSLVIVGWMVSPSASCRCVEAIPPSHLPRIPHRASRLATNCLTLASSGS
jgi:hypothetical protein